MGGELVGVLERQGSSWAPANTSVGTRSSPRVDDACALLEVLPGTDDETKRLVRAYGRLMREDSTTTTIYAEVFWAKGAVALTPDEWWLTRLCELRNAIVHGDEIADELWSTIATIS
jgi:hypothetical protein